MPATDLSVRYAEDERTHPDVILGTDPGDAATWEIFRVHCPACDRPIALVGDEEQLPQHAVLPIAWHPFSATICPGSGVPTDDLAECETTAEDGDELATLLTLPTALNWRTQPFSHVAVDRAVRASRIPAQRMAA